MYGTDGQHDDPVVSRRDRVQRTGTKYQSTPPSVSDGDNVYFLVDAAGRTIIASTLTDDAAFTPGTSLVIPIGAHADEASPDSVDEGDAGALAMTVSRELYVRPSRRGAGEVKTIFTSHTSATKGTKITPASGKQVRMISLIISTTDTTATKVEVYFGAGANIASVSDTAIAKVSFPATVGERFNHVWPDGAGPIGAADAVVSVRCDGAVSADVLVVMQWREE
jgi:hypothetical protein